MVNKDVYIKYVSAPRQLAIWLNAALRRCSPCSGETTAPRPKRAALKYFANEKQWLVF